MEISRPPDVTRPPAQNGRFSYKEMAEAYMRILDRETKRNSVLQGSLEFTMARIDLMEKEITKLSSFIGKLPASAVSQMLDGIPAEETPSSIFLTKENLTKLFERDIQLQEE